MGLTVSHLVEGHVGIKQKTFLVVGLHGAGKTTFLQKLKQGEDVDSLPTIGFNIKTVEYKNICFVAFDVGGSLEVQPDLDHYYQRAQGIVFVVDSSNRENIIQAREELQKMMNKEILRDAVLLVLANKQDLPNAMNSAEVGDKLGLYSLRQRGWYNQPTCALSNDGLFEGMEWLAKVTRRASE